VLCMSASVAGPAARIIHAPSGSLHLYGGSQKGKTAAGVTSATPWGKGAHGGKIQPWRATPNAIESVAARASDGVLVMRCFRWSHNALEAHPDQPERHCDERQQGRQHECGEQGLAALSCSAGAGCPTGWCLAISCRLTVF
jgi:hypothetical protein